MPKWRPAYPLYTPDSRSQPDERGSNPREFGTVKCILEACGFVLPDSGADDIFLPQKASSGLTAGDRISFVRVPSRNRTGGFVAMKIQRVE
jgi:hypothetical protein